jgi:hypothetical protein
MSNGAIRPRHGLSGADPASAFDPMAALPSRSADPEQGGVEPLHVDDASTPGGRTARRDRSVVECPGAWSAGRSRRAPAMRRNGSMPAPARQAAAQRDERRIDLGRPRLQLIGHRRDGRTIPDPDDHPVANAPAPRRRAPHATTGWSAVHPGSVRDARTQPEPLAKASPVGVSTAPLPTIRISTTLRPRSSGVAIPAGASPISLIASCAHRARSTGG